MKTAKQAYVEVILAGCPVTFSQWDGSALRGMDQDNVKELLAVPAIPVGLKARDSPEKKSPEPQAS